MFTLDGKILTVTCDAEDFDTLMVEKYEYKMLAIQNRVADNGWQPTRLTSDEVAMLQGETTKERFNSLLQGE